MAFSEEGLLARLPADASALRVAYSGGVDSHVLLFALHRLKLAGRLPASLNAIHVNHGLSPQADRWQGHCRQTCAELGIPLAERQIALQAERGNLEQRARQLRYGVFAALMEAGEWLLTAHHLDDQVETLLLRLIRGTGLTGLAGIAPARALGSGRLLRPLLDFSREELLDYARQQDLQWVEDESNEDIAFDRNYLRAEILPRLQKRWPGYRGNWQRTAMLCGAASRLLREAGEADLEAMGNESVNDADAPDAMRNKAGMARAIHGIAGIWGDSAWRLNIAMLARFSRERQLNILRCWFARLQEQRGLPPPDYARLERVLSEVMPAAADAEPVVSWGDGDRRVELRRFLGWLHICLPREFAPPPAIPWRPREKLELPAGLGFLSFAETEDKGLDLSAVKAVEVRFRRGGEKAKPAGRRTRSLKKLFQDYQVPPWLRDRIPLIYCDGELAAAADLFICEQWLVEKPAAGQKLHKIRWQRDA